MYIASFFTRDTFDGYTLECHIIEIQDHAGFREVAWLPSLHIESRWVENNQWASPHLEAVIYYIRNIEKFSAWSKRISQIRF